jgi:hypothetical protein
MAMTLVLAHKQRVAVRRRALDRLHRDDAAAADPVLDHHLLAERLGEPRRHQAPVTSMLPPAANGTRA